MWIFLDLVAAESLVVFVTAIFPNFVIALALVAFANGLWMSVGGFLVTPTILNPFWKYVFHYIDYQVRQGSLRSTCSTSHANFVCTIQLTRSAGLRLPGDDGQRILETDLFVWFTLPMHVRNGLGVAVPDPRNGRARDLRLCDRQDGKMGRDSCGDHCRVSLVWLDCASAPPHLMRDLFCCLSSMRDRRNSRHGWMRTVDIPVGATRSKSNCKVLPLSYCSIMYNLHSDFSQSLREALDWMP